MKEFTYEDLKLAWQRGNAAQQAVYNRDAKAPPEATIGTLKMWGALSGDFRFSAAIKAAKEFGYDQQRKSPALPDPKPVYAARIEFLRGRGLSERMAAARAAVEYAVPANGFEAAVKQMTRAYKRWLDESVSDRVQPQGAAKKRG
jgi:hypothetical protein